MASAQSMQAAVVPDAQHTAIVPAPAAGAELDPATAGSSADSPGSDPAAAGPAPVTAGGRRDRLPVERVAQLVVESLHSHLLVQEVLVRHSIFDSKAAGENKALLRTIVGLVSTEVTMPPTQLHGGKMR